MTNITRETIDPFGFYPANENSMTLPVPLDVKRGFRFGGPNVSCGEQLDEISAQCRLIRHGIWQTTSQIYQVFHDWMPLEDPELLESSLCFAEGNIRDLRKFRRDMKRMQRANYAARAKEPQFANSK
jgi:hypothetical protein